MLAVVGPSFVVLSVRPYEPPLRKGMTPEEVRALLGDRRCCPSSLNKLFPEDAELVEWYDIEPDLLGNGHNICVWYTKNRLCDFNTVHLPRTLPPWLDDAFAVVRMVSVDRWQRRATKSHHQRHDYMLMRRTTPGAFPRRLHLRGYLLPGVFGVRRALRLWLTAVPF
jgi:hypothetical protein